MTAELRAGIQYSATRVRCVIAMDARRALHRTNGRLIVKPIVVLAAKCLGPGRLRLEMVKLAHDLSESEYAVESSLYGRSARDRRVFEAQALPARRRAA